MNPGLILRHLRWALLAMLLMVAAGAAALFYAEQFHASAIAGQASAGAAQRDAQGKLARAREEEQELRATAARFQQLAQRGIIGEERRIDWIEQIRRIREARKLFDLQYEIAPQQPLDAATTGSAYPFMASPMRLTMQLLHEEDLLGFLDDLTAQAPAYLRTRRCAVDRLPPPATPPVEATPQLRAECELDWITIRKPPAGTGAGS